MKFGVCLLFQAVLASPGCKAPTLGAGVRQRHVLSVPDPHFTVDRSFLLTVPSVTGVLGREVPEKLPVLFLFHGYTNSAAQIAGEHHFDALAQQEGFAVVYAEGMADGKYGGSWNLGSQDDSTCERPSMSACYDSCKALGQCGKCSWHTCHDDLAYVDALVAQISAQLCIDTDRLYLYGESAGAMFTYKLLEQRPDVFAAAVPEQGLPYLGLRATSRAPVLHMHDRQDATVPLAGGRSEDGWKYESVSATLAGLCEGTTKTPYAQHLMPKVDCQEFLGCPQGPVVQCLYDGQHGDLPDGKKIAGLSDNFIWGFLAEFSLHQPAGEIPSQLALWKYQRARWEHLVVACVFGLVFLAAAAVFYRRDRVQKEEAQSLLHK